MEVEEEVVEVEEEVMCVPDIIQEVEGVVTFDDADDFLEESEISLLMQNNDMQENTEKCSRCEKAFSSLQMLHAHIGEDHNPWRKGTKRSLSEVEGEAGAKRKRGEKEVDGRLFEVNNVEEIAKLESKRVVELLLYSLIESL